MLDELSGNEIVIQFEKVVDAERATVYRLSLHDRDFEREPTVLGYFARASSANTRTT